MSAPDPVLRQVWASLITALEGINGGTDYHTTMRTVTSELTLLHMLPPDRRPAVMVIEDPEAAPERVFHMAGQIKETLAFMLECCLDAKDASTHARMNAYANVRLDIEYALTRDVTRGGLASATFVRKPKGFYQGSGDNGTVFFHQRVDVVVVRDTGER